MFVNQVYTGLYKSCLKEGDNFPPYKCWIFYLKNNIGTVVVWKSSETYIKKNNYPYNFRIISKCSKENENLTILGSTSKNLNKIIKSSKFKEVLNSALKDKKFRKLYNNAYEFVHKTEIIVDKNWFDIPLHYIKINGLKEHPGYVIPASHKGVETNLVILLSSKYPINSESYTGSIEENDLYLNSFISRNKNGVNQYLSGMYLVGSPEIVKECKFKLSLEEIDKIKKLSNNFKIICLKHSL